MTAPLPVPWLDSDATAFTRAEKSKAPIKKAYNETVTNNLTFAEKRVEYRKEIAHRQQRVHIFLRDGFADDGVVGHSCEYEC